MSDTAPLTSRSPGAQMRVGPGAFGQTAEPDVVNPMQELQEPASVGKSVRSLVFRVLNAITGSKKCPATHRMPPNCRHVLIHLANRADNATGIASPGVACLEGDTGLGATTVRACLADLLAHGWISDRGMIGPPNNAVRAFEVHDSGGEAWEPTDRHVRKPPSRPAPRLADPGLPPDGPPNGDRPPYQAAVTRPSNGGNPALERREGGLPPGGDKPPIYHPGSHPINHPETTLAHARAEAQVQTDRSTSRGSPPQEQAVPREKPRGKPPAAQMDLLGCPADPEPTTKRARAREERAEAERLVWAAYLEGRARKKGPGSPPVLDEKRRAKIAARLKDGFTVEDLEHAARGIWRSGWHVQQGQTSFELALRDAEHVERFRDEDLEWAGLEARVSPEERERRRKADEERIARERQREAQTQAAIRAAATPERMEIGRAMFAAALATPEPERKARPWS